MIARYSRPEMAELWTEERRYRAWLDVELAVCRAWHEQGVIPAADLESIRKNARIDARRIEVFERETRHDVIAFLSSLEEIVGPSARFIHLGCTSSDILDTAAALLLREAGGIILAGFDLLLDSLRELSLRHKGLPCMGRTHGIHAEPTTFALKLAGFHEEFRRHKARFAEAVKGISVGKISGAVGTYAFLSPEVEARACEILGLEADPVSTQIVQRDRHAHYFTALALAAGGVERLCTELRHLQRTEVHEVEEGFARGQKGSSAMPHKRNPVSSENMCGLARLIRSNALAAMENQALWHERDISHSSVERIIMPDSTILMDYVLHRLNGLIAGLRVLPENMERNLRAGRGVFFSQRVLTALLEKGLPRQEAYAVVQRRAMESQEQNAAFPDLIRNDPLIRELFRPEELDSLFDTIYYTRYETAVLERVFGRN
jgi:adenylosuccinate lyase